MRLNLLKRFFAGAALALLLIPAPPISAEVFGDKVEIATKNFEGLPELMIGRPLSDAKILGYLSIPDSAPTRFPAVIIEHDSLGPSDDEFDYARMLNEAGYATLVLDEYTDRRVRNREDAFNPTRAADALFALKFLAGQAQIDSKRIAMIGFSRGGYASYLTAVEAIRKGVLGAAGPRFAAHAAYYPVSPTLFVGNNIFTSAPVRLFLGREDNIAPIQPWMDYLALLRIGNAKWAVEQMIYEGGHGFERSFARRLDRGFINAGRCPTNYYRLQANNPAPELFRLNAGKLVPITRDQLVTTGCTIPGGALGRTSDTARTHSREDLIAFLKASMPAP